MKLTGYEFWNDVLKRPLYVAAPMVDMSELSFRMLCRRYKADLCYSPMLHSTQYLQDLLYRLDTFSTEIEDRPLIVQFCANDPDTFVNAASMISSKCNAVDLNLGCPQAIAKKGYYGAFLQDDWNLIYSIVRKASVELQVPVTCKMRILPDLKNSIDYARMLEKAGCSVITVHGRTREQKGHATGLASWDAIKEIKTSVKIPIIANGNILSFDDIKDCLYYTGADAVMSAEALLQNPTLFSGKNPPVWCIVKEYLQFAEKYNTPIKCVRCHLYKILYLCIYEDSTLQENLANSRTFSDFYEIADSLKCLSLKCDVSKGEFNDKDNDSLLKSLDLNLTNIYDDAEHIDHSIITKKISDFDLDSCSEDSCNHGYEPGTSKTIQTTENMHCNKSIVKEKNHFKTDSNHLPIWLCHSRPRIVIDSSNRGCYRKYFESSTEQIPELSISKKRLKKLRRHERVIAAVKDKRKIKKLRKKQKMAEEKQNIVEIEEKKEDALKITKKEKKMIIRGRLLKARGIAPKVCINLGFSSEMEEKELNRLSSQLRRLYGSNRQSMSPFHLYFSSFRVEDELYKICLSKNDGFSSYVVEMTEKAPEEMFNVADIIYLSPDSGNILQSLDCDKVYIIGGIVDGSVKKNLSLNHAKMFNIQTARLPIAEYLVRCSQNPGCIVLTVNQVFDILLKYYETGDWTTALSSNVPPRKGYCAPSKLDELVRSVQNSNLEVPNNDLVISKNTVTKESP